MEVLRDRPQRECREFDLFVGREMKQRRKVKEVVASLEPEKEKCCRGSRTGMWVAEKQCWQGMNGNVSCLL